VYKVKNALLRLSTSHVTTNAEQWKISKVLRSSCSVRYKSIDLAPCVASLNDVRRLLVISFSSSKKTIQRHFPHCVTNTRCPSCLKRCYHRARISQVSRFRCPLSQNWLLKPHIQRRPFCKDFWANMELFLPQDEEVCGRGDKPCAFQTQDLFGNGQSVWRSGHCVATVKESLLDKTLNRS
jgi:hypothetical protein